jgi:competence protein ComEC
MKKYFLIGVALFILLGDILIYQSATYNDKKLHVVVCDVGQGDAILLRTPGGSDILIDGGPDDSVLACLGKHMRFWDRTLEMVILTHPHADHLDGLITISNYYKILSFVSENLKNNTEDFTELMKIIASKNMETKYVYAGDRFLLGNNLTFQIVGPSKRFLDISSPGGLIAKTDEQASLEILIEYGNFLALLTGDSQAAELEDTIAAGLGRVSLLQVPHHGSRFGLNSEILDALEPKIAVISVGKNNKYGHPTNFILDLLNSQKIKTLRTDEVGDIEVISDGKSFTTKN